MKLSKKMELYRRECETVRSIISSGGDDDDDDDDDDYGEIEEETSHIFDNLERPVTYGYTLVAVDEELAKDFEPLAPEQKPVRIVQGNVVCSEMRLVCAFDSDKVSVESYEHEE